MILSLAQNGNATLFCWLSHPRSPFPSQNMISCFSFFLSAGDSCIFFTGNKYTADRLEAPWLTVAKLHVLSFENSQLLCHDSVNQCGEFGLKCYTCSILSQKRSLLNVTRCASLYVIVICPRVDLISFPPASSVSAFVFNPTCLCSFPCLSSQLWCNSNYDKWKCPFTHLSHTLFSCWSVLHQ